jgi:hypothetical protein
MHSLFDMFMKVGRLHNCTCIPCFLSLLTIFFKSIESFFVPLGEFIRVILLKPSFKQINLFQIIS